MSYNGKLKGAHLPNVDQVIYEDYSNPAFKKFIGKWPRQASRGIVRFSNGDILIFVKEKNNQYKLPGGGKKGNETPEETFIREVHEETGYKIKNISKVGITKDYTQISHIFIAEPDGKPETPHLDKDEAMRGAKCIRIKPEEALAYMEAFINARKNSTDDDSLIQYHLTLRDFGIIRFAQE